MIYIGTVTRIAVVVLFSVTVKLAYAQDNQTSVDVLAIEYPPFTSADLEGFGVSFVLLDQLFGKDIQIKPLFVPPARAGKMLLTDNVCLSFYPVAESNNRFVRLPLSKDKVKLTLVHANGADAGKWTQLNELAGKTVAVLRTNRNSEFAKSFIDANIELVFVETILQGFQLLLRQRVDYAFGDNISLSYLQKSYPQFAELSLSQSSIDVLNIEIYANKNCSYFPMLLKSAQSIANSQ